MTTIPARFNGPVGSANGGYACGVVAGLIDGPARVILRRPPPLEVELVLERDGGGAALRHGDTTIATAAPARIDVKPPTPPTVREASDATAHSAGLARHPFPTCFVCGPERAAGDGLRIFPGHVHDRRLMAAPWIPDAALAGADRLVRPEFVWAALDCPTGWVTTLLPPAEKVVVLGTFAVALDRRPVAGHRYVVAAWPLLHEGRRFLAGAALWSDAGELHAVAQATWVQVSREAWAG